MCMSTNLEYGAQKYFDKSYDELTEEEKEELEWNLDGENTYNDMVEDGVFDDQD